MNVCLLLWSYYWSNKQTGVILSIINFKQNTMKKITLLFAFLITSIGFSQDPTSAAPVPTARDAGDVMSLFTQTTDNSTSTYTDIAVANFNPNWGASSGDASIVLLNNDRVIKYPTFDYQGTIIGQNLNISSMTMMHIDVWTNNVSPNVFLISASTGEQKVNIPAKSGSWTTIDIPLTDFTSQGLSLSDIKELKFDGGDTTGEIFLDNIYFWRPAVDPAKDATLSNIMVDGTTIPGFSPATEIYTYKLLPGTTTVPTVTATTSQGVANAVITPASSIPGDTNIVVTSGDTSTTKTYKITFEISGPTTVAPTPPNRNASDVISLYSDAYTQTDVTNFDAGWCGGNSVSEITFNDDKLLAYQGNECQGIEFTAIDASSFTHMHVDVFIDETNFIGKVFNLKFVDTADNDVLEVNFNDASTPKLEGGKWISIDVEVNLSAFDKLNQFGITNNNKNNSWYDNLYFYKGQPASVENNELLGFSMFPNPATNRLNISAKETIQNADVFNVLGKKVMSLNINKTTESIDISNLSSGIYLVKYNSNGKVGTAKFIKE